MTLRSLLGTPIPSLCLMAAFSWVSHQPGSEIRLPDFPYSDKILHAAAYALLGVALGLWAAGRRPRPFSFLLAAGIGILFGMADEFHQSLIPMREAGWPDALADAIGVTGGVSLVRRFTTRRAAAQLRR